MLGVNKKPLKAAFWLLVASALIDLINSVKQILPYLNELAFFPSVLFLTNLALFFTAIVLLCIHMKLQQNCKTDFLYPIAFGMMTARNIDNFVSAVQYRQTIDTLILVALLLLEALIVLDYFVFKKPVVSLAAHIGMVVYCVYEIIMLLLSTVEYYDIFGISFILDIFPSYIVVTLMTVGCTIYAVQKMKYENYIKTTNNQEKEQMLRTLKLQYEAGKFSERQYRRRKLEILKFM